MNTSFRSWSICIALFTLGAIWFLGATTQGQQETWTDEAYELPVSTRGQHPKRPGQRSSRLNEKYELPAATLGQYPIARLDFLTIKRQIVQENLPTTTHQDWVQRKPPEAERPGDGKQLLKHGQIHTELEVLEPYASPAIKHVLNGEIERAKVHFEKANSLMEFLAKEDRS